MIVFTKIKKNMGLLKQTFTEFISDNVLKLSAALSYYTVFSIAPMLFLIISFAGAFYGPDAVRGRLFTQLQQLVGSNAAAQIQEMIANTHLQNESTVGAITGIIILLVGATGVFTEIQDSINFIWSIKAKPKKGWLKLIINRLISFSLIVSLGFLMLVSLVINAAMDALNENLSRIFSDGTFYLMYGLNLLLIFTIITFFFTIIYKVLPDATIYWKDAMKGAMFTAVLFLVGKFLIGYFIGSSKTSAAYGAAASLVIVLLWVYYTSVILYFGAEFTKVYALQRGKGIKPHHNAVYILKEEKKEIPPFAIRPAEADAAGKKS
ncbi:MAG: YihY/virulence factor BrkB family protein [Chitinophagaceae bacterium]|nr:MAG: YihY/virulence factor BrkB family protein [Chitinophagaceae bacterium]